MSTSVICHFNIKPMKSLKFSVVVILLLTTAGPLLSQQALQLRHIIDGTFAPQSVQRVNWMLDGAYYTALDQNAVRQYSIQTGEVVKTLADGNALGIQISDYEFSADEKRL